MKKIPALFFATLVSISAAVPIFAFAQPENFAEVIQIFIDIFGYAIMLIYVIALLIFLKGIAAFVLNTADEKKRAEGKQWMLWAVIIFFVSISIWGIVNLLVGTFNLTDLVIPQLKEE